MTSIYPIYRWCSTPTQLLTCSENGHPGCEHVLVTKNSPGKHRHDSADKVKLSYINILYNTYSSRDIQKHIFKHAPTTTNSGKQVSDILIKIMCSQNIYCKDICIFDTYMCAGNIPAAKISWKHLQTSNIKFKQLISRTMLSAKSLSFNVGAASN